MGLSFFLVLFFGGCIGGGEDPPTMFRSHDSGGPRVHIDPLAEYTPEIPFPNDLATVRDHTSPTGRRLNISAFAPTVFEEGVREHLNALDGFGTFQALSVAFDAVLELSTVRSDITQLANNLENTVLLVDLGSEEPYWGSRFVPLDAENDANFPTHIAGFPFPAQKPFGPYTYDGSRRAYYQGERVDEQLLFQPDNREDLDGDGEEENLTFYEKETDTLIVRPVIPLRQATEYLVVLTRGIKGKGGNSISSPYPYVAHTAQLKSLERALPYLQEAAISPEDVAFAWTFTTQSVTAVLEAVRDGLDGKGKLGHLADSLPFELDRIGPVDIGLLEKDGNPYLLDAGMFDTILPLLYVLFPAIEGISVRFDCVDYIVMGSFKTPAFRATEDEIFDIDLNSGRATVGAEEVPFVLSVPKTTEEHQPPFPVALYCHGNESIRFEALASANYLARQGIAVMGIDAVGHGPILNENAFLTILESALEELGFPDGIEFFVLRLLARLLGFSDPGDSLDEVMEQLLSVGFLNEVMVRGRAVDLSGDGWPDHGSNFWSANAFKTRDVVRQTVIDVMYLLRILKQMDQSAVPSEPVENPADLSEEEANRYLIAGDFNMDNVLDIGGIDNIYYQSGISLGGILSSIILGIESGIEGGLPVVPGGGLSDVILRSDLKSVMYRLYYQVLGPVILGLPDGGEGTVALRFQNDLRRIATGKTLHVEPGGTIHGVNLRNGEEKWAEADEGDGRFVIGVAADEGDILQLTSYSRDKAVLDQVELVSPLWGFGLDRNTPRFRRFVSLAQILMEPGDPINYAPHWFMDPLPGARPKNVFELTNLGDLTVPINNQIALARAGGLLGDLRHDMAGMLERNDRLIARRALLGHDPPLDPGHPDYVPFPLYDVDDRDGNNWEQPSVEYPEFGCDGEGLDYCARVQEDAQDPFAPIPWVDTGAGKALVRFPYAKAHEYFALPRGPAYAIYTDYAKKQAGAFLAGRGQEWQEAWDCSILRDPDDPANPEFGPDCPDAWNE